jgi:protocatechuate 3,4-dioxygenase, beta subunit
MKHIILILLIAASFSSCAQHENKTQTQKNITAKIIGGGCECCEAIYQGMPEQLNYETTIPPRNEPGELLEISGTVFQKDGKTPAPNVILYIYHTNAKGYYEPAKDQAGCAKRNGHLRGWMKTNEKGEYKFNTIKPAPYPKASIPAHIHPVIKEPGKNEYYIDEFLFDDDTLLTANERSRQENRGGSGIVKLSKSANGIWIGKRDIVLGKNIPDYY